MRRSIGGYSVDGGEVAALRNAIAACVLLDVIKDAARLREMAGCFFRITGELRGTAEHGAFPVGIDEPQVPILPGVPVNAKVQLDKGPSSYQHGFAILDLDGPTAQITYYEDSSPNTALYQEQIAADGTVTP